MRHRFVSRRTHRGSRPTAPDAAPPVTSAEPVPGHVRRRTDACQAIYARALLLWPGLDRGRLVRTNGDLRKVARLVGRRTIHSEESILQLLQGW
jgi:hypothetical protein